MSTSIVEPERIRTLNTTDRRADGEHVLYWMQASQRAEHNPALEHAVRVANDIGVPLVVAAVVVPDYPEATARQFAFMLGGLGRALAAVERRGATAVVRTGEAVEEVLTVAGRAAVVVVDRGYLRHQRQWREEVASRAGCSVVEVEGDVVVPIDVASDSQEHAARTLRPKINAARDRYLVDLRTTSLDDTTRVDEVSNDLVLDDFDDVAALLRRLDLDDGPSPVQWLRPGTAAARTRLHAFLDGADAYEDRRDRFTDHGGASVLSPYLHFGQISPVRVALDVIDRAGERAEAFLEELIVRRELAVNYVARCADYDAWAGLPTWARSTLDEHADDARDHVYTAAELEAGATDDAVWNAIMAEIRDRGWVHNQLRMYWGKQFVRWTNTPRHAHRTLLELNNRWFLDGRDPSSYANVGWCFGLHDRGFAEREVSGTLRPFTTAALRRKDDLDAWLDGR
jgi:deoxyribodipyrimidine photo-lyase